MKIIASMLLAAAPVLSGGQSVREAPAKFRRALSAGSSRLPTISA
jgi:hypothetical protein